MVDISNNILVAQNTSIEEVFRHLNDNKKGIVFVVDQARRALGCLTDGDIRRQLLVRNDLSVAVSTFMNRDFVRVTTATPREHILKLLDNGIHIVPMLDGEGRIVQLCSRDDFRLEQEMSVFVRSRAPARISFGGGGSDLTHYFLDQGGMVISATIAKYAHASLRPRSDSTVLIRSHDLNCVVEADDAGSLVLDGKLDLIKSIVQLIRPDFGFELDVSADFPVGSGLGGSASIAVAIIGCFNGFRTHAWTRHQIAEMAFQAERLILNIPGGWQDQYAAAFGGFNYMEFSADENLIIPLRLECQTLRELEACFLLCHTGRSHDSGAIHSDQKARTQNSAEAQAAIRRQKEMSVEMKKRLLRGDVYGYGRMLHEAWLLKRQMSNLISDDNLDRVYQAAMEAGALGGKLLGAGGGGYFLFFAPPFERHNVSAALEKLGYTSERVLFDSDGLTSWKMREPGRGTT
jgi:D-glycero-alpha-D-manno-heptose-7-phosphate kinase